MITITALVEDTCCLPEYDHEHGLSLFIQTPHQTILFDTGSSDRFVRNAAKMHLDLSQVDAAFISHGHNDHGGGLAAFLAANSHAPVYVQETTFGPYYGRNKKRLKYAGLDQALAADPRLVRWNPGMSIAPEIRVIAGVPSSREIPDLLEKRGRSAFPDRFQHEQSIVLADGGRQVLISGCSHCGIDTILTAAQKTCGKIDAVVGGFHLIGYDFHKPEDLVLIDGLADRLSKEDAFYYTCHCTSAEGYTRLKRTLGSRIGFLSTGCTIQIG